MTIRLTRRATLQGLGLAALAPVLPAFAEHRRGALNLLAVGDWGRGGAFRQSDVAARMGETAKALNARMVISVGDNFYEDGVASVDDPQWKSSFEDVYAAPSLQVPWQVALGNHDYRGEAQAQIDYTAHSPRWRLPARYRSVVEAAPDGATVEVFFLDTSPFIAAYRRDGAHKVKVAGQDADAQIAWFDRALGASRADWKIVVGHHPIWPQRPAAGGGEVDSSPEMVQRIDPLLRRHGVRLYLNGHDHDLQHVEREGAHYVCTGAGSKMRTACTTEGSDFCDLESGFVTAQITGPAIRLAYRDWKGATVHVVEIARN